MYKLRDYQQQASDAAVRFFGDKKMKRNAIMVLPTGAGKSLVIADIANRLEGHTLVFQPSKEILEQNYQKLCSYGVLDCSIYSASFGRKEISRITFATIGSVSNHTELFQHFRNIIIDECHLVNPKEGMYKEFLSMLRCKVLGLTATPYRLSSSRDYGAMLKFITRTVPRVFSEVIYQVQISTLLDMGYLSKLNYYPMNPVGWNELNLNVNTTGADYTDKSVVREYERIDFYGFLVSIVRRLLNPKVGGKRKGILVFTRFLKEAERLTRSIPGTAIVSGETSKASREMILQQFKAGEIPVVANVGVLVCGFDYPELDTIVIARPTMSLALYYQIVGRAIRPHPNKKEGWIVDLAGNIKRFGKVEDLRLVNDGNNKWSVWNKNKQLTNVRF
ncbi:DEAD/DEAH box helicase family protein [uncultured Mediterranea sp.]|uniref:DEAD/DEAH box helicase n=1 Tax=uncultured Mediterranea sp. TaxID=1926662 RepID=UPI0027D99049|nr:DEAD/DEAH box helicase family protein [uncultured Mediterranea sp.]